MRQQITIILLSFILSSALSAQQIKTINAGSTKIRIRDGDEWMDGELVPQLRPDVYVYHRYSRSRTIAYVTDRDSISFDVKNGDVYDFAIILEGRDTCYQRITGDNPQKVVYHGSQKNGIPSPDTIPFVLGPNNAIHIPGTINGSAMLDLIFDTGANMGVLSEQGKKKGAAIRQGTSNSFSFAGITVEGSPMTFVDFGGGSRSDGVIGYNAFEDKIVEINYDRQILVIHPKLPEGIKSWASTEMRWKGANLFVLCRLNLGNRSCEGLFLFDTGSKWALSTTKGFAEENRLYGALSTAGSRRAQGTNGETIKSDVVILPKLEIANLLLNNVPMDLELPSKNAGLDKNILGNDVLKRFNVFLDYQNGIIYLKPNHLEHSAYNKIFDPRILWLGAGIVIALVGVIFVYRRRRKTRKSIGE